MQKFFTNLVTASLMLGTIGATAQTQIWPTADTNTINASQFKGAGSIFTITRTDTVAPATHKGWYTKGLASAVAAKADSAVWNWSSTGITQSTGTQAAVRIPIASPTADNGVAIFESDYLDTKGSAPVDHSGELVSPLIDASGHTNVSIIFNQFFNQFYGETYVTWSEDGGRTWKPRIEINQEIPTFGVLPANTVTKVKFKGSVGTSQFRVKFIFNGDAYFWTVDDVKLMSITNDLMINQFHAVAPSFVTPKNQVENMRFLTDITNHGTTTATGVKVAVKVARIVAGVGTTIYEDTLAYNNPITPDSVVENKILPGTLSASLLTVGTYQGTYTVLSGATDQFAPNDSRSFTFFIHDSLYRKENGGTLTTRFSDAAWAAGATKTWRAGNYFYVKTGVGHTITTGQALVGNLVNLKGQRISFGIYDWADKNNDDLAQLDERTLVAYGDTLIPASQTANSAYLTFPIKDINTQRYFYPSNNKHYLAVVEIDPTVANLTMTVGFAPATPDYGGFVLLTDSLYNAGQGQRRYGPVLGVKPEDAWYMSTFTHNSSSYAFTPAVRLTMVAYHVKDETLTAAHKIAVFPNPAQESVTLSVDLPQVANQMMVQVLDNSGRLVQEQIYNHVQKENLTLNVQNLVSGAYMLRISTPDGMRTTKLMITK